MMCGESRLRRVARREGDRDRQFLPPLESWARQTQGRGCGLVADEGGRVRRLFGTSTNDMLRRSLSRPSISTYEDTVTHGDELAAADTGTDHVVRQAERQEADTNGRLVWQNPGVGGSHHSSVRP